MQNLSLDRNRKHNTFRTSNALPHCAGHSLRSCPLLDLESQNVSQRFQYARFTYDAALRKSASVFADGPGNVNGGSHRGLRRH
jgi:hypothetical protein